MYLRSENYFEKKCKCGIYLVHNKGKNDFLTRQESYASVVNIRRKWRFSVVSVW